MLCNYALLALALVPGSVAAAQAPIEFPAPFRAAEATDAPVQGELRVVLDAELHSGLSEQRSVRMRDFPLPGNRVVDLQLEQRSWRGWIGAPHVDGVERMDLFLDHDLTTWRGQVVGEPDSQVYLGFSRYGSSGFVRHAGGLFLVGGRAAPDGRWDAGHSGIVDAEAFGGAAPFDCGTSMPSEPHKALAPSGPRSGAHPPLELAVSAQHARQAVSVDYWVYQDFGSNLNAEIAYVYQLLWAVAEFYYEELAHPVLDFLFTMPYVEFWTTSNDPWDEPDAGGDVKDDVLDEFEDKWDSIFDDKKVHLALLLCGKSIGGGKASGAGIAAEICPGDFAGLGEHSVVGGITGNVPFPVAQGGLNWDFFVIAHEVGHNLGGLHTHENGLDNCDDEDPGDCPEGTIMSYCHACNMLGVANIDIAFHAETKLDIWSKLDDQDCLPLIGVAPIHVEYPTSHSSFPDGTPNHPYNNLFEGVLLASLLGGPAGTLRVEGTFPVAASGVEKWPAMVLDQVLLVGGGIVLEGFFLGSGATLGD